MKKIISLAVAMTIHIALMAQTAVSHINVLVGQTLSTYPTGHVLTTYTVESGGDCVQVSQSGSKFTFKGLKAGDAVLKLTASKEVSMTLYVHVRRHSYAEGPEVVVDPPTGGEPGTLVNPVWKGHYQQMKPSGNYNICVRHFNEHGQDLYRDTYACVANEQFYVFNCMYIGGTEAGDHYALEVHYYDYPKEIGYTGGMREEDDRAHLFYDDGFEIEPRWEHVGRNWFKTFAPQPWTDALYIQAQFLFDFGRDVWKQGLDEDIYQPGSVLQQLRQNGEKESLLSKFYRGDEEICGVKCWVFDFRKLKGKGCVEGCWWVDQDTGMVLQYIGDSGAGFTVTRFDLRYYRWDVFTRPDLAGPNETLQIGELKVSD